ncbi:actin-like ATPase domain-containing protein [Mycena maculata]|uniref:Actin-like ATPase domain-containing protein n=1 Tax=Mycena maculata TaxID=230809 RepID=A0AAD7NW36_9AGAR|nr:actin-like ATPase domain-containing protein [Mycena maculata]
MSCCRQPRSDSNLVALASQVSSPPSRHQVIDQQPTPLPELQLHHPTHVASSFSWSTNSPPLPPTANYAAAALYDDRYFPAVEPPGTVGSHARQASQTLDEGKLVIAIDFGTTFSGVAYGSSRIASGKVQQILNWPGSSETFRKIPTCLLYDEEGRVLAWGLEAKNSSAIPGTSRYEWFKLFLDPRALRDESALDPRLPALPPGKTATDLITEFLSCLWEYAREQITRDIGAIADLNSADVWVTVPAAWDARGCALMRDAAIAAGLVQSSYAGDTAWRDRLKIITEPEAAAVHCAHLTDLYKLLPSQNFIVCDAGGGTVDLAVYKIIGDPAHLEIAEIAARSGANCGSLFLDLRFRALVQALLDHHPAHLDAPSLAYFMHSFSEADKLNYIGSDDDDTIFYFNCFNVEDPDDPSVGLINGQLAIPGRLLREAVFDPVVDEVLDLITKQLAASPTIDALMLVGGFSGSAYLKARIEEKFSSQIRTLARPPDSDTATLRGAARYALARRPLVSQLVVPRSYVMKVKLPAEPEDRVRRPAYVRVNDAGVEICENRLQYLVQKGAIIRKGQRITTRFCKFSRTRDDTSFTATLYVSPSPSATDVEPARYADETRASLSELCVWRADVSVLPAFRAAAAANPNGGFYTGVSFPCPCFHPSHNAHTDFMLGLEIDSAEVRGVLLSTDADGDGMNAMVWGRVVFAFM